MSERHFSKVGSIAALLGLMTYTTSAVLHPSTPPHETEAAFADYAAEPHWVPIHLAELLGILLMCTATLALAWRLRNGAAGVWAMLGGAAMVVVAAVYSLFAVVDGVALGILVERWAAAEPGQQEMLYETAFAVRQIEAGLFGMQWLMFGLAAGLFAVAFFASAGSPIGMGWLSGLGWLSVLASMGALTFGIVQTWNGFTETSMAAQTGLLFGVVWLAAVGLFLYRRPEHAAALTAARRNVPARTSP